MKKKLVALLMGIAVTALGGAALTACNSNEENAGGGSYFQQVYSIYYANAAENGETPLTYEQWLESIKGDEGDKGETGDSAYQVWLDAGNAGTEADFIEWIKGEQGVPDVGIAKIDVEHVTIDGDTVVVYRFTMTDGSVISKYINSSEEAEDTEVYDISLVTTSVSQIAAGVSSPDLVFKVSFETVVSRSVEYRYLSEMEVIGDMPDFTKAGSQDFLVCCDGYYEMATVIVEKTNFAQEIVSVEMYNPQVGGNTDDSTYIWFLKETDEYNLSRIFVQVNYEDYRDTINLTTSTVSGIPTVEEYLDITVEYKGFTVKIPVCAVDSTCSQYIEDNASDLYGVQHTISSQYVFKGEDPFANGTVVVFAAYSIGNSPHVLSVIINEDMIVEFNNTVLGEESYRFDFDNLGLPAGGLLSSDSINIVVFDYTSLAINGVNMSGGRNVVAASDTFPEMYVDIRYTHNGYYFGYDENNVLLTEEMVTNLADIDFSKPGIYNLKLKIHDLTFNNFYITVVDTSKTNIISASLCCGNYTSELYTLGEMTVGTFRYDFINAFAKQAVMQLEYFNAIDGQIKEDVIITKEMLNFSELDFTKVGTQRVYLEYGEGLNKVRFVVAEIEIRPESYENYDNYSIDDLYIELSDKGSAYISHNYIDFSAYATYTNTNNNIVMKNADGTMYYTLVGAETVTIQAVAATGTLVNTYRTWFDSDGSADIYLVVEVYTDYVTVSLEMVTDNSPDEATTETTHFLTYSLDSIKNGTLGIFNNLYELNTDGTMTAVRMDY